MALKPRIIDPFNLIMFFQKLSDFLCIATMPLHSEEKCFQSKIKQESVVGTDNSSYIPHQMCSCLNNIGSLSKLFCIDNSMVRLIWFCQFWIIASCPVKFATVYDYSTHSGCMTIHIFCSGMNNN